MIYNLFLRALSLALFGTEDYHLLLRRASVNLLDQILNGDCPEHVRERIENYGLVDFAIHHSFREYIVIFVIFTILFLTFVN